MLVLNFLCFRKISILRCTHLSKHIMVLLIHIIILLICLTVQRVRHLISSESEHNFLVILAIRDTTSSGTGSFEKNAWLYFGIFPITGKTIDEKNVVCKSFDYRWDFKIYRSDCIVMTSSRHLQNIFIMLKTN